MRLENEQDLDLITGYSFPKAGKFFSHIAFLYFGWDSQFIELMMTRTPEGDSFDLSL